MMALALWLVMGSLGSGCVAVEGDRVLARHIAQVVPAFRLLAPDEPITYAPAPGARRFIRVQELARLAARYGLQAESVEICLERATRRLEADEVLASLRRSVGLEQARIELLDFSRYPVPPGELEFPRAALGAPAVPGAAVLWRGRLRYEGGRSVPVWARVRITVPGRRVVAVQNLPQGRPIQAWQLRLEEGEWFPFSEVPLDSTQAAEGKVPRAWIRAGSVIYARMLAPAREVERGDKVEVEVASGAARVRFQARAQTAGRAGETIILRSPLNGKTVAARVQGPGKVVVDADALKPGVGDSHIQRN